MELGEKLLKARQEAGLSQRQLCGDVITRNMLSQIEHGTARPSMATLQYLASRLGKSIGYFLEEETASPNQTLLAHAGRAFQEGKYEEARTVLAGFQQPDPVFDLEYRYLYVLSTMEYARGAIGREKTIYARELLVDCGEFTHGFPGLERQRILLLGSVQSHGLDQLCQALPELDEELYLRACAAQEEKCWDRGLALLEAMEHPELPKFQLLRGKLLLGKRKYYQAAACLAKVEDYDPEEVIPLLEHCYQELEDYKKAYQYAVKKRGSGK